MIPAADLAAMYDPADGLTVPCVFGALSTYVHFHRPAVSALGGDRQTADYSMRYRVATLAGLTKGSSVTVDGVAYTVRARPAELDTGDEAVALLQRP